MSRRAAIYARISKDRAGDALGVERQVKLCRELAERDGWDVTEVLVDNDVSAYDTKRRRPAFEQLLELVAAEVVDAVIVWHPDRLYRRAAELERIVPVFETARVPVVPVTAGLVDLSTAAGRMQARLVGAVAQYEAEHKGERHRAKADELALAGRPPGGRPAFGYRWSDSTLGEAPSRYVVVEDEAAVVLRAADLVEAGESLLSIARRFTADGVPTREGRPWHHSTVRSILLNPAVAGLRIHRREVVGTGDWPAILTRARWESIRGTLSDPARKRRRPSRPYLLTGLLQSPAGDHLTGRPAGRRRTYATRTPCQVGVAVDADELDQAVTDAVLDLLDRQALPAPTVPTGDDLNELEAELAELARLRGEGAISLAEWLAAREPLQRRLEDAQAVASSTRTPGVAAAIVAEQGSARERWGDLDLTVQRAIVATVVERITVHPADRGRWTPLADRIEVDWRA